MKELLKIEYLKIKHYTVFRAFMLLFIVLAPLIFYALSLIKFPSFPTQREMMGFPGVWSYLTYISGWLNFLPGILVASLVCNEITYKTQRQNIIDGLSKKEIILSKFYFVFVLTVGITVYVFVLGTILGSIFTGISHIFDGIEELFFFFVQTLGFLSLAMLLAVIIRKSALTIIAYLVVFIFMGLILENMMGEELSQWMPFNMLSDLTQFPLNSTVTNMQRMVDPTASINLGIDHWVQAAICLGYIAGFVFLSYFIMKKRDV